MVLYKDREKSEDTMSRKDPMPQIVLVRLLEKGIIGPTAESATLVWKIGMDDVWLPIQRVSKDIAAFLHPIIFMHFMMHLFFKNLGTTI